MTIQAANELIRQLSLEIGITDLDFGDLSANLLVDDRRVTVEYLPEAVGFLIYGPIGVQIDRRDAGQLSRLLELAHFSATIGGGALSMAPGTGHVVYSIRVEIEGLTVARLGEWIGQVSTGIATFEELLGLDDSVTSQPQPNDLLIRV